MSRTDELLREMGVTAEDLVRRKRQVGLTAADAEALRRHRDEMRPQAEMLAETFFSHLAGFEEARPLLGQRELLDRARALKREHLAAMFDGDYGLAYARQRVELGHLYGQAALPTRLFLGAYEQVIARMDEVMKDHSAWGSVRKVAFFDIALVVDALIAERERVIGQQQEAIRELSTPVLKLRERLLLVPVFGMVDGARARQLTESTLQSIYRTRARVVVIDVTGVANVDTRVAHHLFQTVSAARLMGVRVIVSGLSADVSQSLTTLGVNLGALETVGDLQGALEDAEKYLALRA